MDGGVYTSINVPGALWTDVYSISADGDITGAFEDANGIHGFVASPSHLTMTSLCPGKRRNPSSERPCHASGAFCIQIFQ